VGLFHPIKKWTDSNAAEYYSYRYSPHLLKDILIQNESKEETPQKIFNRHFLLQVALMYTPWKRLQQLEVDHSLHFYVKELSNEQLITNI
jgi:hypothetical protein